MNGKWQSPRFTYSHILSIFKLLGVLKAVEHLLRVLNNAWASQVAVVVKKKKKTCLRMQETY